MPSIPANLQSNQLADRFNKKGTVAPCPARTGAGPVVGCRVDREASGTHDLKSILDKADTVLHPGEKEALEAGEGRGTPLGSMHAAIAADRRQAADVVLAAFVVAQQ
jgi:hypothetical protein